MFTLASMWTALNKLTWVSYKYLDPKLQWLQQKNWYFILNQR